MESLGDAPVAKRPQPAAITTNMTNEVTTAGRAPPRSIKLFSLT
jgi:hypothetical protein